ncbi:3-phosphoshikimate 1-carboxyvinyltransferase [Segetibacter koreensis]|uniref:3-phosphoshikimate 1-carboxyvinyltransferase n=1 Tax=Segetibacter koreensis TaxID=398037 RepID=UPI000371C802|nr:3-phosphoshikimate 1-carboxyvinyltransferase [Segetibacter koreensis]
MTVKIQPSTLHGNIFAPASKSSMQRACAAALLCEGASEIINPGKSNDDLAALDVIQKLGARVVKNEDGSLTIHSQGVDPVEDEINCGESGLGIRMFTPIAALSSKPITINGTGSLLTRPMHFFDEIFPLLGIEIKSREGRLPLQIKGPLHPANIEVDGSLSSQFLTGLLMAFGASVTEPVTIKVNALKSKPYIDLTLKVMESFGRKVTHTDYEYFHLEPQAINYEPQTYRVEGDWSGGSFLLVAGAIAGKISVEGLDISSTQADKAILQALKDSGCFLSIQKEVIEIGPAALKAFHFDATDCPDLFPPLVALASYCDGQTIIKGVSRLAHKESNRGLTLQEEFAKMGVEIILRGDEMLVKGSSLKGANVHSRHDHRIAMACAVAALRSNGEVAIEEANAINKSYPDFYAHLKKLGATVLQ